MTTLVIVGLSLVAIAKSTSGLQRVVLMVGVCVGLSVALLHTPASPPQPLPTENCR